MNNEEKILSMLETIAGDVSSLKSDVSSLKSAVSSLQSDVGSLKDDVGSLQSDVSSLKDDVSDLKKSQARMEFEHGEKLAILFDGYQLINEKLDDHTERLERIEGKLETHEIQIKVLDSTKANKRKAK